MADLPELELDTIEIINTVLNAIEDEDNVLPIQFFSANRNALLPILNSNNSTQNAEIKLLGPSAERTSYAIKYSPQDNFCGEDSFSLQVWDGSKLSDEIILTDKVENVNDAPYLKKEFPATQIAEGEIASFDLLEYFDDVDLYNPVRYMDEISFSLPKDAPDWLTIENNRLYLQPGYETANNGEESKEFLLGVNSTDLAGELAELQLPITVNDVKIVSFNPAELWEYTTSSETPGAEPASWKQLYAGWNLLALPYAANQKEINTIFNENVTLWVWNKQQNKYKIANHLQAGQGFWIYFTTLENIKTKEITLENGRTTAAEIESGWNLQGNSWITQQIEIEEVIILQKNIWQKTDKIPQGKAAWILSK